MKFIRNQYSEIVLAPRPKAVWELGFMDWMRYIKTRNWPVTEKSYFDD